MLDPFFCAACHTWDHQPPRCRWMCDAPCPVCGHTIGLPFGDWARCVRGFVV